MYVYYERSLVCILRSYDVVVVVLVVVRARSSSSKNELLFTLCQIPLGGAAPDSLSSIS